MWLFEFLVLKLNVYRNVVDVQVVAFEYTLSKQGLAKPPLRVWLIICRLREKLVRSVISTKSCTLPFILFFYVLFLPLSIFFLFFFFVSSLRVHQSFNFFHQWRPQKQIQKRNWEWKKIKITEHKVT